MSDLLKPGEITNRYVLPVIEEKTSYGFKRMDPYTKLFEERIIFLGTPIDDTVANDVMAQLLTLESMDPDRDIMLYINSPGGSFTALTAIYDTMQFVRPDIMTICLGQAASAAAVILTGGTKGKRDCGFGLEPPIADTVLRRHGLFSFGEQFHRNFQLNIAHRDNVNISIDSVLFHFLAPS